VYCLVRLVLASFFMELWKEADDGCSAYMWLGVNGVSVFYAEHGCAGYDRFGVDYDSIFLSPLSPINQDFSDSLCLSKNRNTRYSVHQKGSLLGCWRSRIEFQLSAKVIIG